MGLLFTSSVLRTSSLRWCRHVAAALEFATRIPPGSLCSCVSRDCFGLQIRKSTSDIGTRGANSGLGGQSRLDPIRCSSPLVVTA